MTEASRNAAEGALREFAGGFAAAVAGLGGASPDTAVELLPADPPPVTVPLFAWKQPFVGLPGDAIAAGAEPDTLAIGQLVLAGAGIGDASSDDWRSTFRECLSQAFSVLGRALTGKLQREVTPSGGEVVEQPPAGLLWGRVQLSLGEQPVPLFLGFPAAWLEALAPPPKAMAQAAAAAPPSASPSAETVPATRNQTAESKTFDLLLDVELPVSVSFGHAFVPLKDVLKLTTGSIVELSRAIVEPVDIVVNNCVIAKGEVVVIEGNFGVRIQHVISRSERLRSLQ